MATLKAIRKRIGSVKSTQKITRAMKMVAGARLNRAQARITALRPYAKKTQQVLGAIVAQTPEPEGEGAGKVLHPLLARRPLKKALYIFLTSDRGLCGSFNANLNKLALGAWKSHKEDDVETSFFVVGRKGRDFLRRRGAPVDHVFAGIWEKLGIESAREVAETALAPFKKGEVQAVYLIYSQFKSAMTQVPVVEALLPVPASIEAAAGVDHSEYIFEPDAEALLSRLVPMYLETSIYRALLESQASELGARMTAMDSATKNAKDMIADLTLQYNRARQAAITKELMEIIGGAEALKE